MAPSEPPRGVDFALSFADMQLLAQDDSKMRAFADALARRMGLPDDCVAEGYLMPSGPVQEIRFKFACANERSAVLTFTPTAARRRQTTMGVVLEDGETAWTEEDQAGINQFFSEASAGAHIAELSAAAGRDIVPLTAAPGASSASSQAASGASSASIQPQTGMAVEISGFSEEEIAKFTEGAIIAVEQDLQAILRGQDSAPATDVPVVPPSSTPSPVTRPVPSPPTAEPEPATVETAAPVTPSTQAPVEVPAIVPTTSAPSSAPAMTAALSLVISSIVAAMMLR
jgi:hypothetical protein